MKVDIGPLKENKIKEFKFAEELLEFYRDGEQMIAKGNISYNGGVRSHNYLKGSGWFLFYEDSPVLTIHKQCFKSSDGLEEHTGAYHIWAGPSKGAQCQHILAKIYPKYYTPETGYGLTTADDVLCDKERAFINSPIFEQGFMNPVKPWTGKPVPGDRIGVKVGGVLYKTLIDKSGAQRFIPNSLLKHLSGGNGFNIVQLTEDYINGKFARREFLEFLMGLGIFYHTLAEMPVFGNLEFENPLYL